MHYNTHNLTNRQSHTVQIDAWTRGMRCKSILRVESQTGTRLDRENGF